MFERMVQSVKRCLRKVLGNAKLSSEELTTILTEVECTLNSRLLTYQYEEGEILTPSHLIFGRRHSPFSFNMSADLEIITTDSLTNRSLFLRKKLYHFWNRWKKEYLVNQREQHQMKPYPTNSIHLGDVVLLEDDNSKRLQWKMGIIQNVIFGKDGQVRGVEVRTINHGKPQILCGPIQTIYPLEVSIHYVSGSDGQIESIEQRSQKSEMGKEGKESNESEEKIEVQSMRREDTRPQRIAACNARAKAKLMLDS